MAHGGRGLAILIAASTVVAAGCATEGPTDTATVVGQAGGAAPTGSQAAPSADAGPQTEAEFEDDYQQQLDSGQLAVGDADGDLVGWMDPEVYYAGAQDPLFIEVRSYDTEEIVGYRVRHVGFVPEALLNGDGSLEDSVMELYGEEQAAGALRQEEFRTFVDSFGPGELAQAIDEHTGA